MARVYIDSSVVGQEWFKRALPELEGSSKITFVFSTAGKAGQELAKVRKLFDFLTLMHKTKRAIQPNEEKVLQHIQIILQQPVWQSCSECDDEHIFSICFLSGPFAVFTGDMRLASCRSRMRKTLSKEYNSFSLIASEKTYFKRKTWIYK